MREDLTGQVFGRWSVVCYAYTKSNRRSQWYCVCDCGEEKIVCHGSLKSGHTKSCGCLKREAAVERGKSHGMTYSSEYSSWGNMKSRCYNSNVNQFENHGGRGITVCDSWLESFENFYEDMGDKPEPKNKYSIERIDNNGNYCKENCKWATASEQCANQRIRGRVDFYGVSKASSGQSKRFRAIISTHNKQVYLGTFDTELEAATAYDDKYEEIHGVRRNGTEKDK